MDVLAPNARPTAGLVRSRSGRLTLRSCPGPALMRTRMTLVYRARSVRSMPRRVLAVFVAALTAPLIAASPAVASLADEVLAGQAVAAQLQSGQASCKTLSDTQFERLGEHVMDRMVGSRAAHAAMNQRMTQAIGAENLAPMHELMGRRYAGCTTGTASGVAMGPGMMNGAGTGGGWGAMMGSSAWGWMHNGAWRHMSADEWRSLASRMMGSRYATGPHHRWSAAGVLATVFGASLVGGLLVLLAVRRPWQRRPPAAPRAA
jgi:hypothetical protein